MPSQDSDMMAASRGSSSSSPSSSSQYESGSSGLFLEEEEENESERAEFAKGVVQRFEALQSQDHQKQIQDVPGIMARNKVNDSHYA